MYLQDDQRATGLTRLLSIGLRILTLLEHVARCHLAEKDEKLSGLYAGNPQFSLNITFDVSLLYFLLVQLFQRCTQVTLLKACASISI